MDIIIRPAETSDFDSVVHILNQVQALHVNWRPDIYKESKDFSLWMLFRMLWIKKLLCCRIRAQDYWNSGAYIPAY